MNIEYLELYRNEWLTDALVRSGYGNTIPSNVILNKTLTGVGATYCEIHAERNSIIIEPNVPVIQCKVDNEELPLMGVYAGVSLAAIRNYLKREDILYKKILTTPESFYKVRNEAQKVGIDIYGEDWFCLFDECEKITQDHDYRMSISQPISDFFNFRNKAMVSATPLTPSHPQFLEQLFSILQIRPTFDYKKNLALIVTNSFKYSLLKRLEEIADSECICIFMNKTDSITAIIQELDIQDYKIFCSDKSVKKLHGIGIAAQSEISYPFAKYNFFTCRFYSGLDIELLPIEPDIIMLTDLRSASYTMIDPLTEAIQIQGRFRKNGNEEVTYNSFTHIANVNSNIEIKSNDELDREIAQYADTYFRLKYEYDSEQDTAKRTALLKDIKGLKYNDLIDNEGNINYFAIDNLHNEERVKSYYISGDSLRLAYESAGYFNVDYHESMQIVGNDDILKIRYSKFEIEKRKEIVRLLESLRLGVASNKINHEVADMVRGMFRMIEEADYIMPIFDKIGIDGIERCGYKKGLLNKAIKEYDRAKADELRFLPNILTAIFNEFPLNEYIPKKEIQARIKAIYAKFKITAKVTQTTISDYYEVSESNSKENPSYKLNRFKFDGGFLNAPP
ncbi:MAG: hypothetical protein NC212_10890 [Staphylococcus sp.]|nr:hypothetical protein [Staphylococcus sp.]